MTKYQKQCQAEVDAKIASEYPGVAIRYDDWSLDIPANFASKSGEIIEYVTNLLAEYGIDWTFDLSKATETK